MNAIAKFKATVDANAPITFDRQRMEKALASKMTTIPAGLSREQKRKFILEN